MSATAKLKAPFPYFGGKSAVADLVWDRLGNPDNYVEPFAGTAATLLRRPSPGKVETINDANHFVVNFWRAVKHDRAGVIEHADWAVSEADLHARHNWLLNNCNSAEFVNQMAADPEFYCAKSAGWWVWGQCCWIGSGWCDANHRMAGKPIRPNFGPDGKGNGILRPSKQLVALSGDSGAFGRGVNASAGHKKRPEIDGRRIGRGVIGSHAKRPLLDNPQDRGVAYGRPQLGDEFDIGRGVNGNKNASTCVQRREWLSTWIDRLSDRLRLVRVCYGDWNRICDSKTTMDRLGLTGAMVDPPYAKNIERLQAFLRGETPEADSSTNRAGKLYHGDGEQDIDLLVANVNRWAQKWGKHSKVRIALCGYDGEHNNLVTDHGWEAVAWKANGGYGNRGDENTNKGRERIWFSPHCVASEQGTLF